MPAAGTPDYPMMGPLSDGRDGAPHAMAGQKEGSGGQNEGSGPIVKGMCAVCQKVVYNVQPRTKNATGTRVHACIRPCLLQTYDAALEQTGFNPAGTPTIKQKNQYTSHTIGVRTIIYDEL